MPKKYNEPSKRRAGEAASSNKMPESPGLPSTDDSLSESNNALPEPTSMPMRPSLIPILNELSSFLNENENKSVDRAPQRNESTLPISNFIIGSTAPESFKSDKSRAMKKSQNFKEVVRSLRTRKIIAAPSPLPSPARTSSNKRAESKSNCTEAPVKTVKTLDEAYAINLSKVLEKEENKLGAMQSNFKQTCKTLKRSCTSINLVHKTSSQLIVNNEHLLRLPFLKPDKYIRIIERIAKECVTRCLFSLEQLFEELKVPENAANWHDQLECFRDRFRRYYVFRMTQMLKQIDLAYAKPSKKTELTRTLQDIQDKRQRLIALKANAREKNTKSATENIQEKFATEINNRIVVLANMRIDLLEKERELQEQESNLIIKEIEKDEYKCTFTSVCNECLALEKIYSELKDEKQRNIETTEALKKEIVELKEISQNNRNLIGQLQRECMEVSKIPILSPKTAYLDLIKCESLKHRLFLNQRKEKHLKHEINESLQLLNDYQDTESFLKARNNKLSKKVEHMRIKNKKALALIKELKAEIFADSEICCSLVSEYGTLHKQVDINECLHRNMQKANMDAFPFFYFQQVLIEMRRKKIARLNTRIHVKMNFRPLTRSEIFKLNLHESTCEYSRKYKKR